MITTIKILFTIMIMFFLNANLYATEIDVKVSDIKTKKVDSVSKETQVYMDYINLLDKRYESQTNLFSYMSKLFSVNMDKDIDLKMSSVVQESAMVAKNQKSQSSNMTIIARKTIFEW